MSFHAAVLNQPSQPSKKRVHVITDTERLIRKTIFVTNSKQKGILLDYAMQARYGGTCLSHQNLGGRDRRISCEF
ncbi:hypothetical protein I79_001961 [Cricetulus griseus]|uniref:Uncharacterized protein n=1 Tax=Cricetulus griseus TaxID=10029 RepID=G3GW45_CRIGR|nr:hypothetical protein I79_001961 [Cricetulus griseus]